jgi:hypothetical protein
LLDPAEYSRIRSELARMVLRLRDARAMPLYDADHLAFRRHDADAIVLALEREKQGVHGEWAKAAADVTRLKPVVDAAVEWVKAHQGYSATDMGDIRSAVHALQAQEPKGKPITLAEAHELAQQTMADADTRRKEFAKNDPDSAQEPQAETPDTPDAPWLTAEERETLEYTQVLLLAHGQDPRAELVGRILCRTADAKPPTQGADQ